MGLFAKILWKTSLTAGRDQAGFEFYEAEKMVGKTVIFLGFPDERGASISIIADPNDVDRLQIGKQYELSFGQAARLNLTIGPVIDNP